MDKAKIYFKEGGKLIEGHCRNCNSSNLEFYDGLLGYEAIVCQDCRTHHSNAEPIVGLVEEEHHGKENCMPEMRAQRVV